MKATPVVYDWDDLRYFLALHRGASLVDAARAVRADPTTVSRRISALEKALGADGVATMKAAAEAEMKAFNDAAERLYMNWLQTAAKAGPS